MGTWEDDEAEQAAIEARRAQYPAARDALLAELPRAWPPRPIDPPHDGWMDLGDSEPVFRETVRGKTWEEIPAELIKREYAMMSIVPRADFAHLLPAWIRSAMLDERSNVDDWLMTTLGRPRGDDVAALLSPAQRNAVVHLFEALALRWAGKPSERECADLANQWRT